MSYASALRSDNTASAMDSMLDYAASAASTLLTTAGFAGWLWVLVAMPGLLGW